MVWTLCKLWSYHHQTPFKKSVILPCRTREFQGGLVWCVHSSYCAICCFKGSVSIWTNRFDTAWAIRYLKLWCNVIPRRKWTRSAPVCSTELRWKSSVTTPIVLPIKTAATLAERVGLLGVSFGKDNTSSVKMHKGDRTIAPSRKLWNKKTVMETFNGEISRRYVWNLVRVLVYDAICVFYCSEWLLRLFMQLKCDVILSIYLTMFPEPQ